MTTVANKEWHPVNRHCKQKSILEKNLVRNINPATCQGFNFGGPSRPPTSLANFWPHLKAFLLIHPFVQTHSHTKDTLICGQDQPEIESPSLQIRSIKYVLELVVSHNPIQSRFQGTISHICQINIGIANIRPLFTSSFFFAIGANRTFSSGGKTRLITNAHPLLQTETSLSSAIRTVTCSSQGYISCWGKKMNIMVLDFVELLIRQLFSSCLLPCFTLPAIVLFLPSVITLIWFTYPYQPSPLQCIQCFSLCLPVSRGTLCAFILAVTSVLLVFIQCFEFCFALPFSGPSLFIGFLPFSLWTCLP